MCMHVSTQQERAAVIALPWHMLSDKRRKLREFGLANAKWFHTAHTPSQTLQLRCGGDVTARTGVQMRGDHGGMVT